MTVKRADEPVSQEDTETSQEAERTPFALDVRQQPTVVHPSGVLLRVATPEDDPIIGQFYFDMWADYNMTAQFTADWQAQTLAFVAHAREYLDFSAFIAEMPSEDTIVANQPAPYQSSSQVNGTQANDSQANGTQANDSQVNGTRANDSQVNGSQVNGTQANVLGVAACQRFVGLYPWVFTPEKRTHGYIWGVRVVPEARRRGIARLLVRACRDYLRELGCHRVRLHAATQGKALYESLGFTLSNEMVLELDQLTLDNKDK